MTRPTRAAILLAAAGAPVALVVAVLMPGRWWTALAWPVTVLLGTLVDALGSRGRVALTVTLPSSVAVGDTAEARVAVAVSGPNPPVWAEIALDPDPLLAAEDDGRLWIRLDAGRALALVPLVARRRGTARLTRASIRWRGALGLAWHEHVAGVDARLPILPDLRPVCQRGAELLRRHAAGLITQRERGEGTDFDALVEYRAGMDKRAIDWKQSARHGRLDAKEFVIERNNQLVLAIDSGRQMAEPVAGLPRIDRAVSAALLAAWVALKLGDRVSLYSFATRPEVESGFVSGTGAFAQVQRIAAAIDYGTAETNFTLALTTLAQRLTRRSLVVLFTEVTDLTAAGLLVRAAALVARRHLLLVVVLRDEELEAIVDRAPATPDDVTRAVTAAALLRDRLLVLTRLRYGGAHVIEAAHDEVGEALVRAYLDLKRRGVV